jgi:hypothetical protein
VSIHDELDELAAAIEVIRRLDRVADALQAIADRLGDLVDVIEKRSR